MWDLMKSSYFYDHSIPIKDKNYYESDEKCVYLSFKQWFFHTNRNFKDYMFLQIPQIREKNLEAVNCVDIMSGQIWTQFRYQRPSAAYYNNLTIVCYIVLGDFSYIFLSSANTGVKYNCYLRIFDWGNWLKTVGS